MTMRPPARPPFPAYRGNAGLGGACGSACRKSAEVIENFGTIIPTFEDYCRGRWQMSLARSKRLVASAEVIQNLTPIGAIPANLEQTRPLANLEPEQQREVWEKAVETAPVPLAQTCQ